MYCNKGDSEAYDVLKYTKKPNIFSHMPEISWLLLVRKQRLIAFMTLNHSQSILKQDILKILIKCYSCYLTYKRIMIQRKLK